MGGAIKLRLPIATVLVVPFLIPRLTSLSLREQSLWWHPSNVVPLQLSENNRHIPSVSLLLLPIAVGKLTLVHLFPPIFGPRPFVVPSYDP